MNQLALFLASEPPPRPPVTEMLRAAKIDGNLCLWLTRKWGAGGPVCWIMLNPSWASEAIEDPTLLRCIAFSRFWGYGSLVVVNAVPYRSPSPMECQRWLQAEDRADILKSNLDIIRQTVENSEIVIAAWGSTGWANPHTERITNYLNGTDFYCLGKTKDGSPTHPLARGVHRVPDNQMPVPWRGRRVMEES